LVSAPRQWTVLPRFNRDVEDVKYGRTATTQGYAPL
jgi:hypothetical protein